MRTVLSRLLLLVLLAVAVVAVVRASSGGGGVVRFETLGPDALEHAAFTLREAGAFALDAAGSFEEAGSAASDTTLAATAWIVRRGDDRVVWQLRPERPARGTLAAVRDTLRLGPGTYDAYFASFGDPIVRAPAPEGGSLGARIRAFLSRGGLAWIGDAGRWRFVLTALDAGARAAVPADPADPLDAAEDLLLSDSAAVWDALGVRSDRREETLLSVAVPSRVALSAVTERTGGAIRDRASVVRLGARDTVWTLRAEGARWAGGSLKNVAVADTLDLAPGLYRVAFETDRSHAYRDWAANPPLRPWTWGLRVRRVSGEVATGLDPADLDLPRLAGFACVGPDEDRQAEFDLRQTTDVLLVAVGEIVDGTDYDYARLDRRDRSGDWDERWRMDDAPLAPAGGADKNRRATAALTLEPGTYRLRYRTDSSHDCVSGFNGDGGPDGDLWGAEVYLLDPTADPSAISVRESAPPVPPDVAPGDTPRGALIAGIEPVGDDEDRRLPFTVEGDRGVVVVAQGELTDTDLYDYATIERPDGTPVWSMTWATTSPAGSTYRFRRFDGPVALPPGRYVLRYRTDESASGADFGPEAARLWGVRVYESPPGAPPPPPAAPPPPPSPPASPGDDPPPPHSV